MFGYFALLCCLFATVYAGTGIKVSVFARTRKFVYCFLIFVLFVLNFTN